MSDLEMMQKRQKVLADFGDFALQSEDLDDVLREACRLVGEALGTGRAKVLEIEAGGERLFVRAGVGWAPDVVGRVHIPMGNNSSESFSIRAGIPVITQDISHEDRFDVPPFMKEAGVVALANVPIFLPGKRAYGLLQVDDTEPREFDRSDSEFLRTYATILGPIIDRLLKLADLRESEARRRLLQSSWETDAAGVVTTDSPSWRAYTGQTLDEWLGYGWLDAVHPDDRDYAERQWRDAVEARDIVDAEFRLRAPDGSWRWTNVRAAPVLDARRHIEKWAGLNIDIDARKRAEAAVQESAARQALLLRLGDAMRAKPGSDAVIEVAARLLGEHLGASRILFAEFDQVRGEAVILKGWLSEDGRPFPIVRRLEDYAGPVMDALRAGETVRIDDTSAAPPARSDLAAVAEAGTKALLSIPLRVGGRLTGSLSVHQDAPRCWTDDEVALVEEIAERLWSDLVRTRAEEALSESELRFRTLSEGIPQLVWRAIDYGQWTWSSPQWTAFTGQADADSRGWGWLDPVHPDDRTAARDAWERSRNTGHFEADYRIREAATGEFRWYQTRATPVRDEKGRIVEWLGTSTNVQDLREIQERQTVLVAELQHRTRNLMGVVRSVTDRMLSSSTSLSDFKERIHERLSALSRVNSLLSRLDFGQRITFDELLLTEFRAHGFADPDDLASQVRLEGASGILLRSSHVQTLALALHELATNALKHGALSRAEGRLVVSWELLKGDGGERRLRVDWRESGVPVRTEDKDAAAEGTSAAPRRGGYGRELIEKALPYQLKAETSYDLTALGLNCSITLPVSPTMGRGDLPSEEEADGRTSD